MHWETKNVCDSLYCNTCFIVMVWNQTHNISWDACTLPSYYCSYTGQCDWLLISATGQKGYMSLSGWPLKSPTWFSMGISWECLCLQFSSVQFSRSVVSDSLWPHESQHTRPPCPSPTPGVHPNSCPSSWWCHPAISSSVVPFSSCPQSLPASESFPMSQLVTWGDQSTGVP